MGGHIKTVLGGKKRKKIILPPPHFIRHAKVAATMNTHEARPLDVWYKSRNSPFYIIHYCTASNRIPGLLFIFGGWKWLLFDGGLIDGGRVIIFYPKVCYFLLLNDEIFPSHFFISNVFFKIGPRCSFVLPKSAQKLLSSCLVFHIKSGLKKLLNFCPKSSRKKTCLIFSHKKLLNFFTQNRLKCCLIFHQYRPRKSCCFFYKNRPKVA